VDTHNPQAYLLRSAGSGDQVAASGLRAARPDRPGPEPGRGARGSDCTEKECSQEIERAMRRCEQRERRLSLRRRMIFLLGVLVGSGVAFLFAKFFLRAT